LDQGELEVTEKTYSAHVRRTLTFTSNVAVQASDSQEAERKVRTALLSSLRAEEDPRTVSTLWDRQGAGINILSIEEVDEDVSA
jgi:hypothetical protein